MRFTFGRVHIGATILLLAGCASKAPEATPPAASDAANLSATPAPPLLPEGARLALDSGNTFYRAKSYAAALAAYRHATELAPNEVAPWFGISMVATATNNKALGDSAAVEMRKRGGAPGEGSDSAVKAAHKAGGVSPTAH